MFLTFGESRQELVRNGSLLGFDMERIRFLDLRPSSDYFAQDPDYDIFPPSDVERARWPGASAKKSRKSVRSRTLVDGMTQLRHLSPNPFQFRKEALAFLRFLVETDCTVMFTSAYRPSGG